MTARTPNSRSVVWIVFLILMASPSTVFPQSYVEVYPGSKFVCGYMPDGSNLIFKTGGSNSESIPTKKAVRAVKRDIEKIKGRIERLNEIKSSLHDGKLSSSEVRGFTNIMKAADPDRGPLPKGKAERRAAINALIAKLKVDARNRQREIKALQDCSKGKRPNSGNVTTDFLKFRAADGIYIALIMYVPVVLNPEGNPYPQRWFCIKGALDGKGVPRLFTANPCYQGVPAFSGNLCPQFNRPGHLSEFYKYRVFQGPLLELEDPIVLQAEADFKEQYAGGVGGRPRTSLADNCSDLS